MVTRFLFQCRASKKQLQQLVGKLRWAYRVVYGGQTFLRRILDMLNLFQSPSAKVPLSAEFHVKISDAGIVSFIISMASATFFANLPQLMSRQMYV